MINVDAMFGQLQVDQWLLQVNNASSRVHVWQGPLLFAIFL